MTLASALTRSVVTVASLGALAALWRYRPEWPDLPDSLGSPVTTVLLQQLASIAAWMLAALLVLLLLARSFSREQARRVVDENGSRLSLAIGTTRARRPRPTSLYPVGVEARLVVAAQHAIAPKPPEDFAPVTTDAEPAERPLVSLLGPFTIHGAKQSRRGLRARALELIAFLALRRESAQRDEILEAIWPGEDPKRSRHRLYQAVRDARRLLGEAVASERDRYWLDRGRVRVDVDELHELLEQARAADVDGRSADLCEKALSLFRAEPLAGCDYTWSESHVRSLRGTHAELLERVGRAWLQAGDARHALEAAERGLTLDVLNEGLCRLAMEAEAALGLRQAVADRYDHLHRTLEERLGLQPERETRQLFRRLLSQDPDEH